MTQAAYLRQPTLHDDTVVFVSDDDLWRVSARGGAATRLTAGLSEPSTPCLSPDGESIAFIGRDEQHPEVYVMPAAGGSVLRLTWLGPDTLVRGWTPEGRVLFVSTHGQPFFRNHRAYTIDPAGGLPQLLALGQV
jgi:tricorn protease